MVRFESLLEIVFDDPAKALAVGKALKIDNDKIEEIKTEVDGVRVKIVYTGDRKVESIIATLDDLSIALKALEGITEEKKEGE